MIPRLIGIMGPSTGASYQLRAGGNAIGRVPENDLSILDGRISRQHCRITMDQENGETRCVLMDLGSANGTYVNGIPVRERLLAHGDQIRLGDSSLLFLCQEDGTEAEKARGLQFDDVPIDQLPTIAIDPQRARRLGAAPPQRFDVRRLLGLAQEFIVMREVEPLAARLRESLQEQIPAEFGALLEFDAGAAEGEEWKAAARWSARDERFEGQGPPFLLSRSALARLRAAHEAMLIHPGEGSEELRPADSLVSSGIRSVLLAPLLREERLLGALYLCQTNPSVRFTQEHLEWAAILAELAAKSMENLLEFRQIREDQARLQAAVYLDREMIGETPAIREVREQIQRLATTDATVLIQGESGTGKELVAHAIHFKSARARGPFIAINCANLSEQLLESELFGHERGAFTGAVAMKKGKLELAAGGTIFLDEIGEMATSVQAKLLRVLQEREMERLGGTRTIKLDVRVLTATNRNLGEAVREKIFREDLFYRLNGPRIVVPPLRERQADIPLIANYYIARFAETHRRKVLGLSTKARDCLLQHGWPGNIRELQNALETAVIFCETDLIQPEDLPETIFAPAEESPTSPAPEPPVVIRQMLPYRDAVKEARRQIVLHAFAAANGNHAEAARLLDLHPNNLYREIRHLGLKSRLKKTS